MDDLLIYRGVTCLHEKLREGDLVQILDGYDITDRDLKLYPVGVICKIEVIYEHGTRPIGVVPYNFIHPRDMFWYDKSQLRFVERDDE